MPASNRSTTLADPQGATRSLIMDAAERLFSRKGVEGTSLRQVIKEAEVNLGAVNYHFGSKERLAVEVFARRLAPINRERIARLDALEKSAGRRRLKIAEILDAIIRPAVEERGAGTSGSDDLMRLCSRSFQEPNPELRKFVEEQFAEVSRRFDAAILRAIPGLPPEELLLRIHFLFGALLHGQEVWIRFENLPHPKQQLAKMPDREGFIARLVAFTAAGMSAPLPQEKPITKTKSGAAKAPSRKSKS